MEFIQKHYITLYRVIYFRVSACGYCKRYKIAKRLNIRAKLHILGAFLISEKKFESAYSFSMIFPENWILKALSYIPHLLISAEVRATGCYHLLKIRTIKVQNKMIIRFYTFFSDMLLSNMACKKVDDDNLRRNIISF